MAEPPSFFRRHAVKIAAILVIVALYGFARLPTLSESESAALAGRFAFTRYDLPLPPGPRKDVRQVHPQMQRISSWISSVGAAVAAADLDGDGLYNDLCQVDNGTDQIVVMPAPTTGERFEPFTLDPAPLPYDAATMAPMGCLPGDFNEDGLVDLLGYYWGRPAIAFLRREPPAGAAPGSAAFRPVEVAATSERWYTNAATRADFDGDGHLDLAIGNYFPESSQLLDATATSSREHMQSSMSRADNGGRNRLLLWAGGESGAEPAVRFTEAAGVFVERAEKGWTLSMGAADLDGDLLPELYVGNDFGPDRLLHNRSVPGAPKFAFASGRRGFTEPRSKVLGHDSFKGMGTDFADVNGDGLLDIYVSNIASSWALQESHFVWASNGRPEQLRQGIAPYADQSERLGLSRSGWGWDCRFADFDNDGVLEAVQATGFVRGATNRWPELHEIAMGNDNMLPRVFAWPRLQPGDDLSGSDVNPFFVRAGDGRYYDLAAKVGLGEATVSRALAVADVDGDGDLDLAVGNQWEISQLFRNDAPRAGRSLLLDLRLPLAESSGPDARSLSAVGARATLMLPDGRRLVAQVDGGTGHSGKRSPEVHFGLGPGAPDQAFPVEIAWRDLKGAPQKQTFSWKPGRHVVLLGAGKEG